MSNHSNPGGRSSLDHMAGTYMKTRWYLGGGMIGLTLAIWAIEGPGGEIWSLAAAGAVILTHASAMRILDMRDSTVAVLVDVTAVAIAAMLVGEATGIQLPLALTLVGATTLVGLFTERQAKTLVTAYVTALTLVGMLIVEEWDVVGAAAEFIGTVFVAALVFGVISAIRNRLVEVEAARAQTIGVVSHELRNHLTGVVGAIDLITSDESQLGPEESDELLGLAHQQSLEAEAVIEDLLIASRAERGVLDALPEPVDLCPLTDTVIRRTSIEGSDIVYDFSHGPVWAMADPLRYKQVVRNLLTNALRYGGDTIRVSIERIDHKVSVTVTDNGEGIEDVSSLFLPYRGGIKSKEVAGSTGLGLWIARSLAQKMQGDLIYSRRSWQTVFDMRLPAAGDPGNSEESEPSLVSAMTDGRPLRSTERL